MSGIDTVGSSIEDSDEKRAVGDVEVVPSTDEDLYIDPAREAALLRKLDIHIAPVMALIFLLAYLDRSNIGNAASAGLSQTAGLVGTQLNTAVTIFYATYVAAEIPATILMKKFTPSIFISLLMVSWGLVTLFSGFVNSFASLMVTRLLLGVFESGLFPCLTLYLSSFYKPAEMGKRVSYLFVASALSGAFGGLIAFGILRMEGVGGRAGWQWLYLLEGLVTVLFGVTVYWLLPDGPEVAYYLTEEDRALMRIRFRQGAIYNGNQHFEWSKVKDSLTDPKLYLNGCAQLCANVASFGFATFLPTIIRGFGYSVLTTQLITAPIYFWAAIIYITVAVFSDKVGVRTPFLVPLALCTVTGYAILLSPVTALGARLFACFLCATGIYCIVGLNITLLTGSQAPYYKRATSIGAQQAIGNSAGFIAGNIYRSKDAPRYKLGASVTMAFIVMASILYSIQGWNFKRLNKIRDNLTPEERQKWIDDGAEGDAHPDFRYPF
ncbi:major facilitator superfamily transporter [Mrakia frigida]|uniref:allantoate permease family MFS transporter n=1 Tax=Mrakia frigida TaxID=29902 RepID=UPI003FCBF161